MRYSRLSCSLARFTRLGGVVSSINIKSVFKAVLVRFKAHDFRAVFSPLSDNSRIIVGSGSAEFRLPVESGRDSDRLGA